jgi:UDP-GlcNAc:undecaprenyl-phosphate GlcNAc-1-phosphate transferase
MDNHFIYIIIAVLSILASAAITGIVKKWALKRRFGALPNQRRVHKGFIPLLGGLGIYAGFLTTIILGAIWGGDISSSFHQEFLAIFLAGFMVILLGIYDDIKGVNAPQKLLVQFLAITIIIATGNNFNVIKLPFGYEIPLGFMAVPACYLWILTINNAVNLLDGLDGLAAGVSLLVSIVFMIISLQNGDGLTLILAAGLAAGIIGFLFHNYHPATIFMGDTGSLFLGFMLGILSLRILQPSENNISIVVPLVALAIPIGDTTVAFFRRLNQGNHPFKPDKDHIHHRLIFLGLSHRQAVHIIYLIAALYALTAYLLVAGSAFSGVILLVIVLISSAYGLKRMGYLEAQKERIFYGDHKIISVTPKTAPLVVGRIWHIIYLLISDFLMVNLAFYLTWIIRFKLNIIAPHHFIDLDIMMSLPVIILSAVFWMGLFALNDLYQLKWDISRFDHIRRVSKVIVLGLFLLFFITLDPHHLISPGKITMAFYGAIIWLTVNSGRLLLIWIEKKLKILEYSAHKTLLVGANSKAKKIIKDIRNNDHLLYDFVGYVQKNKTDDPFYGLKPLGAYENLPEIIRNNAIEEVIIAIQDRSRDEILDIIAAAQNGGVSFKILPQTYEVVSGHKTEEVIGHPLLRLFPDRMLSWQWAFKRLMDIWLSIFLIILLSPFFLVFVLIQSFKGIYPPFKFENAVGKYGKVFGMLNFKYALNKTAKKKDSSFLYQSKIYKLPALINIILGQMSFVGPRPETVEEVQQLQQKIKFYNRRFQVRPGLTGWAQIKFRYEETAKIKRDQFKHDLFYLENMSITFDIRIILRSIVLFLFRR